jgi:hypothetical protein
MALLLLHHLYIYFRLQLPLSALSYFTDSKSLLKRIKASRTLVYPYPADTCIPKLILNFKFSLCSLLSLQK